MRLANTVFLDFDLSNASEAHPYPGWVSVFITYDLPGELRSYLLDEVGQLILARVSPREEKEEVPKEIDFTGEVKLYASNVTGWGSVGGYRLREDLPEKRPVTVEYVLKFEKGKCIKASGGLNVLKEDGSVDIPLAEIL